MSRDVIELPDDDEVGSTTTDAAIELPDLDEEGLDSTSPGSVDRICLAEIDDDEEAAVATVVAEGQRFMFKHPVVAQAVYRALVAEGRRFATTEDGRVWRARLAASPAIRRLRPLWEAATFNVLDADGQSPLPSKLVELVAQALSHTDIEAMTAFLSERSSEALVGPRRR